MWGSASRHAPHLVALGNHVHGAYSDRRLGIRATEFMVNMILAQGSMDRKLRQLCLPPLGHPCYTDLSSHLNGVVPSMASRPSERFHPDCGPF